MAENLLRISADPFENPSSQHATEVEPDVVAQNATVVSTFQVGRFFVAGASGIGVATSFDAGRTWRAGILPGLTRVQSKGNTFDSVSDPAIAYDAAHGEWLVVSLPIRNDGKAVPGALISRSSDALHWSPPTAVGPGQGLADKTWIVCDGSRSSQFYGHCYVEWDDAAANGLVQMSTSVDGGLTWSAPQPTGDATTGIGGHPVVQPDGTVVVPMNDFNQESIIAFVSTDGGATWSRSVRVSNVSDHLVAGGLRTSPLPTAAVDSRGTIYVVWQDCRFRAGCAGNDLVLSTSIDGVHWRGPRRIPIDSRRGSSDHFIPGLSADPQSGSSAPLALAYYFYPDGGCDVTTCQLEVGYVSSSDGGASWSVPATLAGPMSLEFLPQTRDGLMVGDYIATTFANRTPVATFAVALAPRSKPFDEAMYVPKRLEVPMNRRGLRRIADERPVPGAASDHPPRRPRPFGL